MVNKTIVSGLLATVLSFNSAQGFINGQLSFNSETSSNPANEIHLNSDKIRYFLYRDYLDQKGEPNGIQLCRTSFGESFYFDSRNLNSRHIESETISVLEFTNLMTGFNTRLQKFSVKFPFKYECKYNGQDFNPWDLEYNQIYDKMFEFEEIKIK